MKDGFDEKGRQKYKRKDVDRSYWNRFWYGNGTQELVSEGGMGNPTLENGETEYPFEVKLPDVVETSFNYCFGSFNLSGKEHGNISKTQYQ